MGLGGMRGHCEFATLSGRSAPGSHPIPFSPSIREFLPDRYGSDEKRKWDLGFTDPATQDTLWIEYYI